MLLKAEMLQLRKTGVGQLKIAKTLDTLGAGR
jgi:transcriptional regulator